VLQNPHGILFNPLSVAKSLSAYADNTPVVADNLFILNGIWNNWDFHSRFSSTTKEDALRQMNSSISEAHQFLKNAKWLVITLGSSFQYYLAENQQPVANNHRAPAQWFEKKFLSVEVIIDALYSAIEKLRTQNPNLKVIFTISPVRHIRDGVVENNRSKARLIEAVHSLCEILPYTYYFPAYELVIDVLRDYRFYDIDLVHPNYAATSFVWDEFVQYCIAQDAAPIMQRVKDIMIALSHRSRFPETEEHRKFCQQYLKKTQALQQDFPFLKLEEEIRFFENGL
jgi:hypothetical protein